MHPMLNIAVKAARRAGSIINRAALDRTQLEIRAKRANDFVTQVDRSAESAIIDIIRQAYPDHAILGEESGAIEGKDSGSGKKAEYRWIIDPLDGTTNFIHGFPIYCVSIALAVRGKVEQAVVYDPARNDIYSASKGRGAYLNDRRIRAAKRTRLQDCLISTGFPYRPGDKLKPYLHMLGEIISQCAGVRRPGAAALDLAYVAAGHSDGFFETGLQPWDVAAGSLLVTEAGGLIGNFTGEADFLHQGECVAGNPRIYGQLVATLGKYSKFAGAGDKATVRQTLREVEGASETAGTAPPTEKTTLKAKNDKAPIAPNANPQGAI
jgi:myo-inositol-1(or 4)-monophosphatase